MPAHISTDASTRMAGPQGNDQESPGRFSDLLEACLQVSESLETGIVLQRVIDNARWLTNARYGVLLAYSASAEVEGIFISGDTEGEFHGVQSPPQGKGLLGYLNEVRGPLRIADIASHPRSVGLPDGHPPMRAFLGMPIRRDGVHIGNIYLAQTETGEEFTSDDEGIIERFATHAANAISNAREFEAVLRRKTDLQALVDIAPMGVIVFDAKSGRLLVANRECQRMSEDLQLPGGSFERLPEVASFRRADGREVSFSELPTSRVMQSGETVLAEEVVICLPSGRSITTLVNAAPIYSDDGDIVSVVVAMQDMSPHLDDEKLRSDLLGMVSQELRTPLSTIKGSIVALADVVGSMHSPEPLQLLQIIDHQTELMRTQINSLIDLSRIDAGTLQLSLENTDVHQLASDAINEFRRNHAGQTFDSRIPSGLPHILADRERVDRVLRDLFAHSFRYSTELATITVSAELQDSEVAISVSTVGDCGHSTQPPQLFERLRVARMGERHGSADEGGLALAMAQGVVNAHGGRFRVVRSEDEHGVTFSLTIPVAQVESVTTTSETSNGAGPVQPPAAEKPRVLVIAEDPHILSTMRRTLTRADFAPMAVFDRGDLERLVNEQKPEIAVIDLARSDASEFGLVEWLTSKRQVSVIAILDPGDEANAILAFEKGADGYIVKPFSPTELVARIKASLRRQAAAYTRNEEDGYAMGRVSIDYTSDRVTVSGQPVQLTATEYKLLHELSGSAGRVMTQDELLHRVWGPQYAGESQLLRAYVKTLRQKLGDNARKPSYIFTEHGIGYRMAKP